MYIAEKIPEPCPACLFGHEVRVRYINISSCQAAELINKKKNLKLDP